MLFEEEIINNSSDIKSSLLKFHNKIEGKNIISSILIPNFYLEFEFLLIDLINKISKQEIKDLAYIDFFKLMPNENGNILMDDWQNALEFCQKTSLLGKYKFLVIQNIDDVSINISNALLKILEEPSANTFILLSYNNIKNLLPTIKSRCIVLDYKNDKENFNFLYDKYLGLPEWKQKIQEICFFNLNLLSIFKHPSSVLILESLENLMINFNYSKFKEFFKQNNNKLFFEDICFLFAEYKALQVLKKNNNILSFYNFYFNKKYVKLYNINSESFLYCIFYYICKNV